ncbi:unnamed protein product, partial [Mesorhabditis belari]|uniref:Transmembrane protein n=1 Tax=Mesorhabditis belari TaxID=2138241 RepID=A0AAF3FHB0_9BILA
MTSQEQGAFNSNLPTSGRDPRHIREDCVEENGDESIPYAEYYEGADEFPVKSASTKADEKALVLVPEEKPPTYCDYRNMAVIPGRCVRGFLDISSFLICLVLIVIQLGLLDYYYLTNLEDKVWYGWFAADVLVLSVMIWLLVLAIKHNQEQMEEMGSIDSKVKYAWIGWFVYSCVLVAKIAVCFRLFHHQLPPTGIDNHDKLFDDHLFKLGLSLSVLIFLFLLESHHYTPLMSQRQLYITYLTTAVCLDLTDTIYFLDLLWQSYKDAWELHLCLEISILVLAGVNFVLPTFALFKLRFSRFPRTLMISEKIWALLYVLIVNGPFLGMRIYLYVLLEVQDHGKRYDASLFAVKNVAMIYLAIREVWTRLQYWRQKRRAVGSRGELTAQVGHNEDDA